MAQGGSQGEGGGRMLVGGDGDGDGDSDKVISGQVPVPRQTAG